MRTGSGSLLSRLSRRTTSGRLIPQIDGLRFVAISMVLFVHLGGLATSGFERANPGLDLAAFARSLPVEAIRTGRYGVHIFFVISGFVLALPFARASFSRGQRPSLRAYYLRRLTRLEPPYIIALSLFFILEIVWHGTAWLGVTHNYAAGLVYANSLIYGVTNPIDGVTWSLEVEVQFYLLVPVLALVFLVRPRALRRGVLIAAATIAIWLQRRYLGANLPLGNWQNLSILYFIQFFLLGFLAADIYLDTWCEAPTKHPAWDFAWLGLFALMVPIGRNPLGGLWAWTFPVIAFLLVLLAFKGKAVSGALSLPWIYTIGGMCYSIYLLHVPILQFVSSLVQTTRLHYTVMASSYPLTFMVQALIWVPLVLVVSTAFFMAVERPCMNPRWPQDLWARLRKPAATKASVR